MASSSSALSEVQAVHKGHLLQKLEVCREEVWDMSGS